MRIGKTQIALETTPVQTLAVEAIIVPANNMLWTGSGFAASVRKAAGDGMESEAIAQGPVAIGSAVVTGAGKLGASHIIHAVIAGQDLIADDISIRDALNAALEKTADTGCASVAVPLLTTGTHDIEIHRAITILVDTVITFLLAGRHSLKRLVIIEPDADVLKIIHSTMTDRFTYHGK